MTVELASVVRPGDGLVIGQACAEPQTLMQGLMAAPVGAGAFLGVNYSGIAKPGGLRLSDRPKLAVGAATGLDQAPSPPSSWSAASAAARYSSGRGLPARTR